jgi:hypothetical protein
MPLPRLTHAGVLPAGLHSATIGKVRQAFGHGSARRKRLMGMLEERVAQARRLGVKRMLINGSFVTAKSEPRDIDVVVLLPEDFDTRLKSGESAARWMERLLMAEPPQRLIDLHAAADEDGLEGWGKWFGHDVWSGRKGLVLLEVTP